MKAHVNKPSQSYVGKFTTLEQLKNFTKKVNRYAVGELVFVEEENKMYTFDGYNWKPVEAKTDGTGLELSLFDMNVQILRQQGPLSEDGLEKAAGILEDYISFSPIADYYMLLNHKKSYFTVFYLAKEEEEYQFSKFSKAVLSCASDLGTLYSVSRTEDNQAIEIWVLDSDDTMHCLYLFNYNQGIVKVKR